jgi:hypothetical protein
MKPIQPKKDKPVSAEQLENTFQAILNTEPAPAAPRTAAPATRPKAAPRAAQKSKTVAVKREGKTRLTVDVPDKLYERLEKHKDETGQNFTHLIVSLLNKHFQPK